VTPIGTHDWMLMKKQLFAAAAAIAVTSVMGVSASFAATTQSVGESDVTRQAENTPPTDNWVLYTRPASPGTGTFETGPANPPLGAGSLELRTTTGSDKVFLFNYDHVGTDLGDVDDISYSTYRTTGNDQQVAALNLQVDHNGAAAGGFTTLVFEPVYNTAQGAVVSGEWQDWTADGSGIWWSTRAIPGVCDFTCYVSWNDIVAANPDAVITGGVGVNQGSGNPALTSNVDAFTFDETTYDFDVPPTNKDQCKNDGWKSFTSPSFKNQGDCVSYANNGK